MEQIKKEILSKKAQSNTSPLNIAIDSRVLEIYPQSIIERNKVLFFIAKEKQEKNLYLLFDKNSESIAVGFQGSVIKLSDSTDVNIKVCNLSTHNRKELQKYFDFTNPKCIGLKNSFGFGDRIGLANAAHIRSLQGSSFQPILSQQSIRELTRTQRKPAEVMDAAVWAVFQEGYANGFGADADHLKTTEDIDLMVENGFKMFTFDPGEYVHNEADTLNEQELDDAIKRTNWKGLNSDYTSLERTYSGKKFKISKELELSADKISLKRAILKYGDALAHIKKMNDYLKHTYPKYDSEVEVSVDETESVTSPFEHFFIASELNRLGVKLVSLAPRFIGDFEKGIDYKGDLNIFKKEYLKHLAITKHFGTYKISLHSGSDKFSVYKVIGEINDGFIHVKTAGTSYLEALKVAAIIEPNLFREIFNYSKGLYKTEKKSYHVSADAKKLKSAEKYSDKELVDLFNNIDCRQVLHVTFGRILTDKNEKGEYIFKNKILNLLKNNEKTHYEVILNHFKKHLNPFKSI
jgi:hypothetical protein